jgi:DNA-directed RNA polymerase sigma subunit (sigma70/sigma32)
MTEHNAATEHLIRCAYRRLLFAIFGESYAAEEGNETEATQALVDQMTLALGSLTVREDEVISARFGITDGYAKSHTDLAEMFALDETKIREVEIETIEKLRHPSRSMPLREYLD